MKILFILILEILFLSQEAQALRVPAVDLERVQGIFYQDKFTKLSKISGGKCAWDEILDGLKDKIGFNLAPGTVRFTIEEAWAKFIEHNKKWVEKGNKLIAKDIKEIGRVTEETLKELHRIIYEEFNFPDALTRYIDKKTKNIKDPIIISSSFITEDGYKISLADKFISPSRLSHDDSANGIREMFEHAIDLIWVKQNEAKETIEGIPNILSKEQGLGFLIETKLSPEASGVAMSNIYNHTSIEAFIGNANLKGNRANSVKILFKKGRQAPEINPSFLNTPYEFTLKNKKYSMEENPRELKEAIERYPKIEGRFCPITEEEAVELNRVINALEDEIGVPLDVEWCFSGGKLYIFSIRPIVKDFRRALVEMSESLQKREAIANSPIALGHTPSEGFTGRVVAYGSNVSNDVVMKIEEEVGAYIRIGDDIATRVANELKESGLRTKAKVLVDVSQGGVNAHNIVSIHKRIGFEEDEGFVYVNGPILRDGLLNNITFIPHPDYPGVWLSQEDVTYFSDGLRGGFYAGEGYEQKIEFNKRQKVIMAFNKKLSNIFLDKETISFPEGILNIIKDIIFITSGQADLIMSLLFTHEDALVLNSVRRDLFAEACTMKDIESIQPCIKLLEEILSYPLYPSSWENEIMERLKCLVRLKNIDKELIKQKEEDKDVPLKYRAIFCDADSPKDRLIGDLNDEQLPQFEIIQEPTRNTGNIKVALKLVDFQVSFFYIHLHGININLLTALLDELKTKNPDAVIFIDGMAVSKDDFVGFHEELNLITGLYSNSMLKEAIEEGYAKWREKHFPPRPEKLRVLMVDDEKFILAGFRFLFKSTFSDSDEYEIFYADTYDKAVEILENNADIYAVVTDLFMSFSKGYERFKEIFKKIPQKCVITALFSEEEILKRFEIDIPVRNSLVKPVTSQEIVSFIKRLREDQITEWEKLTGKPEELGKIRILHVEDEVSIRMAINDGISKIEDYGLEQVRNVSEAIEKMKANKYDLVIYDMALPGFNDEFKNMILNTPYRLMLTGVEEGNAEVVLGNTLPIYKELLQKSRYLDRADYSLAGFRKLIKEIREQQMADYQRKLAQWRKLIGEEPEEALAKTILIIQSDPTEKNDLKQFIENAFSHERRLSSATPNNFKIVGIDTMAGLERVLKDNKPDLVITDSHIDDVVRINEILEQVSKVNPEAECIITTGKKSELDLSTAPVKILSILPKPFYCHKLLKIISEKGLLGEILSGVDEVSTGI